MTSRIHLNQDDKASIADGCYIKIQRKHDFIGHFYMIYNAAHRKALDLGGEAMLTFEKILTEVKVENQIFIKQSLMAKDFGISRVTFIRHLNKVRELGLIEPDPKEEDAVRNIHLWRICPFLVWRGDRASLTTYLSSLPVDHVWLTDWHPNKLSAIEH